MKRRKKKLNQQQNEFSGSKCSVVVADEEHEEEVKKQITFLSKLVDKILYLGNVKPVCLVFTSTSLGILEAALTTALLITVQCSAYNATFTKFADWDKLSTERITGGLIVNNRTEFEESEDSKVTVCVIDRGDHRT